MRRYHGVISSAAIRVSRHWGSGSPDEVDDVVQEIYLKMCANGGRVLSGFRSTNTDAIYGFIKVVATNAAQDFFRQKAADKRGAANTDSIPDLSDHAGIFHDLDRKVTLSELHRILIARTQNENGPRDRTIFQLYYRDGMTAAAIAELPGMGLNPKGVEGVLYRLTQSIREAVMNPNPQEMGAG